MNTEEPMKLADLKVVKNGYEPEQVKLLVRQILTQSVEQREAVLAQTRQEERKLSDAQIHSIIGQMNGWVSQLSDAWNRQLEYTKQRDDELRHYHLRDKELQEHLELARAEADKLRADAEETAKGIRLQAQQAADEILKAARLQADEIFRDAQAQAKDIVEQAHEQHAQVLADAQRERVSIVEQATEDIRRIREEGMRKLNQVRKQLEEMAAYDIALDGEHEET